MIHYHGTPITPKEQFYNMAGMNFCVSFAKDQDLKKSLEIGQSVMFDNGAFSTWKRGLPFDPKGFVAWVGPHLVHPHWAVIPDVIQGGEEENDALMEAWPEDWWSLGAPVWHLHERLERLLDLVNVGWPRICLGSSGQYAKLNTTAWRGRMDETFNALSRQYGKLPWVHGLRMLGQTGGDWPLASADSTNVAQNWKRDTGCAYCKARALDAVQAPSLWNNRPIQGEMAT